MARTGFEQLSITGAGRFRFETYSGGQQIVRGAGGMFTKQSSVPIATGGVAAIFGKLKSESEVVAKSRMQPLTNISTAHVQIDITGLQRTIYYVNYLEAVMSKFPSIQPALQQYLGGIFQMVLSEFVEDTVKPTAATIIDRLVYSRAYGRSFARQALMRAMRPGKNKAHWRIQRKEDFSALQEARFEGSNRSFGTDAATYGGRWRRQLFGQFESRRQQVADYSGQASFASIADSFPSGFRSLAIGAAHRDRSAAEQLFSQYSNRSSKSFPPEYTGPKGVLRRSLMAGILVRGLSIQIGIEESVFPKEPYWQFVEYGHVYRWKHPQTGELIDTGMSEPPKPFLNEVHSWMRDSGKQLLETRLRDALLLFEGEAKTNLSKLFSAKDFALGTAQGSAMQSYFSKPGREFVTNVQVTKSRDEEYLDAMRQGYEDQYE